MTFEPNLALYLSELQGLYGAETRFIPVLRQMVASAEYDILKETLQASLEQAYHHLHRLGKIFDDLDFYPTCTANPLVEKFMAENEKLMEQPMISEDRDAAFISCVQQIGHYEITGYVTARAFAHHFGLDEHVERLDKILREKLTDDQALIRLAENIRLAPEYADDLHYSEAEALAA